MVWLMEHYGTGEEGIQKESSLLYECMHGLLEMAGSHGFSGNLWHCYLTNLLVNNENSYSRACEIRGAVEGTINEEMCIRDRYKVAQAGIAAGADLINDIWGLKYDGGQMAETIAGSGLPCCLMHNRQNADYGNFLEDLAADLADTLRIAEAAGIRDDKIILDPVSYTHLNQFFLHLFVWGSESGREWVLRRPGAGAGGGGKA